MDHYISFFMIVAAAVADRFILKRRRVVLSSLGEATETETQYLFPCAYTVKSRRKHGAFVRYQLRDAKKPTMVIKGKSRSLELSGRGEHYEYLAINKAEIKPGEWLLDVQITQGASFWNPLYKIYPIVDALKRTYKLR